MIYLYGNVVCLSKQLTGQDIATKHQTFNHSLSFSGGHFLHRIVLPDFICSTHAHNASKHKNLKRAKYSMIAKHPNAQKNYNRFKVLTEIVFYGLFALFT
jgi:hypothetical protein